MLQFVSHDLFPINFRFGLDSSSSSSILCASPAHFSVSVLKIFPKKTCSVKVSYIFSKKAFPIFRKKNFLYFGKGVFRTLLHLELQKHLELWYIQNLRHIQNTLKHLRWNLLLKQLVGALFKPMLKKKQLIFREMKLSGTNIKNCFIFFQKKQWIYQKI